MAAQYKHDEADRVSNAPLRCDEDKARRADVAGRKIIRSRAVAKWRL